MGSEMCISASRHPFPYCPVLKVRSMQLDTEIVLLEYPGSLSQASLVSTNLFFASYRRSSMIRVGGISQSSGIPELSTSNPPLLYFRFLKDLDYETRAPDEFA